MVQRLAPPTPGSFTTLSISTSFVLGTNTKATDTSYNVNGAAGTNRTATFQSGGLNRFTFGVTSGSESGNEAGSDFVLSRWYDGGGFAADALTIYRNSGYAQFANDIGARNVSLSGTLTCTTPSVGDSSTLGATTAFVSVAVDGLASLSTAGGTTTLTPAQYGTAALLVTGTLTSNAVFIVPNTNFVRILNRTTGAFTLTVKTASGTGVAVSQGTSNMLVADGTNVVIADTDFSGVVVPLASGGTGATTPAAARVALGLVAAGVSLQWTGGAIVANGTYYFTVSAPYAGMINSLDYFTGAGSFTANVQIAGTSVTGLSAVSVTSATQANTAATGANTFAAGQTISVVITVATNSPTNAVLNLRMTKA